MKESEWVLYNKDGLVKSRKSYEADGKVPKKMKKLFFADEKNSEKRKTSWKNLKIRKNHQRKKRT